MSKKILYDAKYYNRTGKSHLSLQAYDFFKKFIFKNKRKYDLGNLMEIDVMILLCLKI